MHEREGAGTCRVRSRRRTFRNASPCEVEQADGGRLEYRGDERSVHLARSTLQHGRQRHSTSHNAQRAQGDGSKTHITNDPAQQEEVKLAEDKQNRSQTVVPHRAQLVEHPEHDIGHDNEVNNRGAMDMATQREIQVRGSEREQRHSRARPDAGQNEERNAVKGLGWIRGSERAGEREADIECDVRCRSEEGGCKEVEGLGNGG